MMWWAIFACPYVVERASDARQRRDDLQLQYDEVEHDLISLKGGEC